MGWFRRREQAEFVRAYEAAAQPDPGLHWRAARFAVLDVETSGLDARRDALLAVGLTEVADGRIRLDSCWRALLRPPEGLLVGAESIRIHELTRAELAEAPPAAEVLPELLARLAGRALVVHVADIDVRFLDRALAPYGGRLRGPIIDTARLALRLHHDARLLGEAAPGMPAPALQLRALAQSLGLPVYAQHDALNDALTTAQVFLAQATRLAQQGQASLQGLLRAGGVRR